MRSEGVRARLSRPPPSLAGSEGVRNDRGHSSPRAPIQPQKPGFRRAHGPGRGGDRARWRRPARPAAPRGRGGRRDGAAATTSSPRRRPGRARASRTWCRRSSRARRSSSRPRRSPSRTSSGTRTSRTSREHGGVSFTAALLKGRSQYVCRAKLRAALDGQAMLDERPGPTLARDLERLEQFAADVPVRGSRRRRHRGRVAPGRELRAPRVPGRGQVQRRRGVLRREGARPRPRSADILVVNHALYCAHLASSGNVLPEHDVVVFDEAHALPDVATGAFGLDLVADRPAPARVAAEHRRGRPRRHRPRRRGRRRARDTRSSRSTAGSTRPTARSPRRSARRPSGWRPRTRRSTRPRTRPRPRRSPSSPHPRLEALRRLAEPARRRGRVARGRRPAPRADQRRRGARRHACSRSSRSSWCRRRSVAAPASRRSRRRLGLDPAAELGPVLIPDGPDSAGDDPTTSSVPGSGTPTSRSSRRSTSASRRCSTWPSTSPSRRTRRGPKPRREEVCGLVCGRRRPRPGALHVAGGRHPAERRAARRRRPPDPRAGRRAHAPRCSSSSAPTSDRASSRRAASGWASTCPGRAACSSSSTACRSRDPTTRWPRPAARAAERTGGSGFRDVDLPAAALVLAQGAGRLIRSRHDHGVVAVLDRRLATAGYRDTLLDALPADATGHRPGGRPRVPRRHHHRHRLTGGRRVTA